MGFFEQLANRITATNSIACIGLDTDRDRIPQHLRDHDLPQWAFNRRLIDATHEHAAAFKLNTAFYETVPGWRSFEETVAYIDGKNVPIVIDAKRGDIGNTARKYAELLAHGDAITVNPYLGHDSLEPFLANTNAGVFIVCRTSNPGSKDLQTRTLETGERLFELVADLADQWNTHHNVGLVVGATAPTELETLRDRVPDIPFLVPGVGAQGGDVKAAVSHGLADGIGLVNSSRSIIYAAEGPTFDKAAGEAAKRLKRQLNEYR